MYNCSACSFSSLTRRAWDRHYLRFGHTLQQDDSGLSALHDSFEEEAPAIHNSFEEEALANPSRDILESPQKDPSSEEITFRNDIEDDLPPHDDSEPEDNSVDEDSWFPWKSKAHFHLTVLYHGSHRRYCQDIKF
jgi:hypothetical protein